MLGLLAVCPAKLLHAAFWRWTAAYSTNPSDAAVALERAIACARAARDEPGLGPEFGLLADCDFILGHCLGAYADHLIEHGAFARAVPLLIESAQIFQARGSRFEMADSIGTLGRLALLSGDMTKAHALLLEAVTLAREFNYREALGNWQPFLGLVTLYGGDVLEAHRLLEESLHLCLDLKNRFYLARVYIYLAEIALWEGKQDETERWLTHGLAHHADQRTMKIEQLELLWLVARLATAKRAYPRAATLFGLAEKVRSQIGYEPVGPARRLADAGLSKARAALGPSLFAEAFAAGQQLSLDDAFAAISVSSSVTNAPS
jgi:tetratricopeptide (TPR) repeat protein